MKSLLTLICENFLSETRARSNDMPLQLQFDFRFRRALKEHLKQMCRTKFCYYTNAKSHYPRVESDLRYSEPHVAKMSPLSSAQLTKSRQKWETTWPIKHGQSVAQKAVRNMSTKDNGSVHTSANLIFHFSNKNGKRKYYLSLAYLHILKHRQK